MMEKRLQGDHYILAPDILANVLLVSIWARI